LVSSDGGCIEWWREAVCACEGSKVCVGAVCADTELGEAAGTAIAKSLEVNATIHTLNLSRTGTPFGYGGLDVGRMWWWGGVGGGGCASVSAWRLRREE